MSARCLARFILLLALAPGCKKASEETKPAPSAAASANAGHADEPEHPDFPKRVRLTKKVIADAKILTAPAAREVLEATISLPGEVVADPDKSARVSAPVAGRLVDVKFKEGSSVKKGDPLATLRVPDIGKVRSAFNATTAKAAAARTNADRLGALAEKGLASKQEALSAKAEADAMEADGRALREQLSALGMGSEGGGSDIVLRAPVNGTVVSRNAIVGQPVTTDEVVATIADLAEVWFLARVFEKDLDAVRLGARADVQLNAHPKEHFEGTVEYLSKQIDPLARTVTARIRLTNRAERLRIGLFGTARVASGDGSPKPASLVVPRSSIAEIGGKFIVFVRQADDDFELHEVVLGPSALGKVEVLSGLREGEQTVVDGVFTLKSAVLRSTLAEED